MYYFQQMLGDRFVSTAVAGNSDIKAYASTFTSGEANTTLVNVGAVAQSVEIKFANFTPGARFYWYSLEGGNDNGEFSRKVMVNGAGPAGEAGGPLNYATLSARSALASGGIKLTVPPRGAVIVVVDKK